MSESDDSVEKAIRAYNEREEAKKRAVTDEAMKRQAEERAAADSANTWATFTQNLIRTAVMAASAEFAQKGSP